MCLFSCVNWVKSWLNAQPMADTEKRTAAMSIVFLRPRKSDSMPATSTPTMEPMSAQPTYQPSMPVERPNCIFTTSVVPEITAVS